MTSETPYFTTAGLPPEVTIAPPSPQEVMGSINSETQPVALEQVDQKPENWIKRHLLGLSAGAVAVSTTVSVILNPLGETVHRLTKVAPWALGGVGASETAFIAGAAVAVAGAGQKIGNPFTLRSRWGEITAQTADSRAVRTGIAVNGLGALGTMASIVAGTVAGLPKEMWPGTFLLAGTDMAATISFRLGIYKGLRRTGRASAKRS